MYDVQQIDVDVLFQKQKNIYTKVQLLNSDFTVSDEIQGVVTSGSLKVSSESDIRRTIEMTILVKNRGYIVAEDSRIWANKYIRVYIGYYVIRTKEIRWYPVGVFMFNENNYVYNSTTRELQMSCVDLVGMLDDTLSGQLVGLETQVKEGESIRNVIMRTATQLGGVQRYSITYQNSEVPYDMSWDTGASVWEILTELRDLYYSYEMFFDEDLFVCQRVPMNNQEPVILTSDIMNRLVIDESLDNSFSDVRNIVEIWGDSTRADYYSESVSFSGTTYTINVENVNLTSGRKISFIAPNSNPANTKIYISSKNSDGQTKTFGPFLLYRGSVDENGADMVAQKGIIEKGKYYVVKLGKEKVYFVGQTQIHALAKLVDKLPTAAEAAADKVAENCDNIGYIVNPESPFTVQKLGRKVKVLSGSDCDGISTDELALERAEYEIYKRARLTDHISLQMILIPWLDVNKKVEYIPYSKLDNEVYQYIVSEIEMSFTEGTMNVTMSRFYPFYPNTVQLVDTSTITGG